MNNIELVLKNFPENVKNHELTNLQESGLTRSFRVMNKTGSHNYHYDIVTWPGHIAISGDVGCFVFSRRGNADMLGFFRGDKILENLEYISEKLVAHDRYGYLEFCEKTLDESLLELASEKGKSIESIREMFSGCGTEEEVCREYFENFDDNEAIPCCTKYTYRYLWCIHAIIWAIEQWDIMNRTWVKKYSWG